MDPKADYITIKPGEDYTYHFELPEDHPPGTTLSLIWKATPAASPFPSSRSMTWTTGLTCVI